MAASVLSFDVDRSVRLGAIAVCAATLVCAAVVWSDLERFADRPAPGFPVLSNGVVSLRHVGDERTADLMARVRPFERVVAVGGAPISSGASLRERATQAGPGAVLDYTFERLDGSRHVEPVAVVRATRQALWRVYVPFLLIGAANLLLSAIAVLVRPALAPTRLMFVITAGLGIPMGILLPDHFEGYRFDPWLRGLAFLSAAALLHIGLIFPQRLLPFARAPGAILAAIYGGSALALGLHLFGFFRDPRLFAATSAIIVVAFILGFGILSTNLAMAARRAPTALERQQARVVLPGPLLMLLGIALFGVANALSIPIHPAAQLLPSLVIVTCLTYAMLGHNIFEFDAAVRRGLTLVVLALVGAATYLGLFTVLHSSFDLGIAWASTVATTAVVLLAVPTIAGARRRADRLVESLLFPAQRARREVLRAAAAELGRLRGPDELLHFLRDVLKRGLGCDRLRVVTGSADHPLTEVSPLEPAQPLVLAPADPLYVAIRRGVPVSATAAPAPDRRGASRAAVHRSAELGTALVVPLPPAAHGIGALLLGERDDGRLYTNDDEALVATLAGHAAAALENAHAVQSLRALEQRLREENVHLREVARLDPALGDLVGRSDAMQAVVAQIRQVAPTDSSVLVQGETGTGKELVVRAIHALSRRRDRVLVQVACAALPEPLLENELFGHERGAFTGADERTLGRLEIADGGTVFFDDVDTLPLGVQAKLLRVVQEGELQKLGGTRVVRVDLRVIAATNRDLQEAVTAGRFREDLYYRLNVVPICIPPLRERREDIALLVEHFLRARSAPLDRTVRAIAAEAMAELQAYEWPGNVRELRNVIERALVMHSGSVLRLPAPLVPPASQAADAEGRADEVGTAPLAELLRRYRRLLLDEAMTRAGGNQQEAARLLGLHRQSFARMRRDLDLAEREAG